jgi:ABC-type uncharacterized transport system fused permease/ATPase subunit
MELAEAVDGMWISQTHYLASILLKRQWQENTVGWCTRRFFIDNSLKESESCWSQMKCTLSSFLPQKKAKKAICLFVLLVLVLVLVLVLSSGPCCPMKHLCLPLPHAHHRLPAVRLLR